MNPLLKRNLMVLGGLVAVGLFVLVYLLTEAPVTNPCAPGNDPARCYRISENLCTTVWDEATAACEAAIDKLELPPTRLTGPILKQCQISKLDKVLGSARMSNPECDEKKKELEDWRRSNPDLL